MPEVISCSQCQRQLRIPDDTLGKKVKCPSCGTTFVATSAASSTEKPRPPQPAARTARPSEGIEQAPLPGRRSAPAPLPRDDYEDDDDRPRPRRRDQDYDYDREDEPLSEEDALGWRRVRTGLTLIIISIFTGLGGGALLAILFFALVGASIGSMFSANQPPSQNWFFNLGAGFLMWLGLVALFMLGLWALQLLGVGYQLGVPEQRGVPLRKLALITFILFCSSVVAILLLVAAGFATPLAFSVLSPVWRLSTLACYTRSFSCCAAFATRLADPPWPGPSRVISSPSYRSREPISSSSWANSP